MIDRTIFKELTQEINNENILFLLGARQVGKTTLLKKLDQYVKRQGKSSTYFNLELPDDLLHFNKDDREVFNLLVNSGEYIFIDEFHYLKNGSKLFKAIYDSDHRVKIIASGSSSMEIHKHLKESMAGRRSIYKIAPLTFQEYHSHKKRSFNSYLIEGGMPGVTKIEKDMKRVEYLKGIVETYIMKDIKSLVKEENVRAFNHLLFLLAERQGQLIKASELSRETKVSNPTVEKYLTILQQTYVCHELTSFSNNIGNELKKSKKYFFYDLGIRNSIISNFEKNLNSRDDKGALHESFAYLELNSLLTPIDSLYFWRTKTGDEVDFIWLQNRTPFPIEIKSKLKEQKIPSGMKLFFSRYPKSNKGFVISENQNGIIKYKDKEIIFLTFDKIHEHFPLS